MQDPRGTGMRSVVTAVSDLKSNADSFMKVGEQPFILTACVPNVILPVVVVLGPDTFKP